MMARLAKSEASAYLDRFRRWLRDHNQPLTRQRELVAEELFTGDGHQSIEELRQASRDERLRRAG